MLCTLICLYDHGASIAHDALAVAPRHTGDLIISDWGEGSVFRRPVRMAKLLEVGKPGIPVDVITPLFEPVLIKMTSDRFVLRGYQIGTDEAGKSRQYAQEWMVRLDPTPLAA